MIASRAQGPAPGLRDGDPGGADPRPRLREGARGRPGQRDGAREEPRWRCAAPPASYGASSAGGCACTTRPRSTSATTRASTRPTASRGCSQEDAGASAARDRRGGRPAKGSVRPGAKGRVAGSPDSGRRPRRRQAGRAHLARPRGSRAPRARHPARRAHGHPRPFRHRRPPDLRRPGHAARPLPLGRREGVPRHGAAGLRDHHRRPHGRAPGPDRDFRGDARPAVRGARFSRGLVRPGAARLLGAARRGQAPLRAGAAGRSRPARGHTRDGPLPRARVAVPPRRSSCWCAARRAPTCGRWRATWVRGWARGRTSPPCGRTRSGSFDLSQAVSGDELVRRSTDADADVRASRRSCPR